MSYRFTDRHIPRTLAGLTPIERAQLVAAVAQLFGEALPLAEAFAYEGYGEVAQVWRVLDGSGAHVFDLWADSDLWMDCVLFAAGTDTIAPVAMIQHGFQATDPAFEAIAAALAEGVRS
jgi:hypothetical protein